MALLPVADALRQILAEARLTAAQMLPIDDAIGATLAAPLTALRDQPPADVSAMDGYAVRSADLAEGRVLSLIGESAAGSAFTRPMGPGEAVRIYTGALVPDGADTILMQENARREGASVTALQAEPPGRHIRRKGLDFAAGTALLSAGSRLDERSIALAAAMGHGQVAIRTQPRIGILATGDELVPPGILPGPSGIIASNHLTTAGIVRKAGGEAVQLGIAPDDLGALEAAIRDARARRLDVLVTLGGASVGERDLVQTALKAEGLDLAFWKIAMRPGKPMMFGRLGDLLILGLPGNPVSSFVCALLFLRPLIRAMQHDPDAGADASEPGIAGVAVKENDQRMDFLRSALAQTEGLPVITPEAVQDSSMISVMARAGALLIREPFAKPLPAGAPVRFLRL